MFNLNPKNTIKISDKAGWKANISYMPSANAFLD